MMKTTSRLIACSLCLHCVRATFGNVHRGINRGETIRRAHDLLAWCRRAQCRSLVAGAGGWSTKCTLAQAFGRDAPRRGDPLREERRTEFAPAELRFAQIRSKTLCRSCDR